MRLVVFILLSVGSLSAQVYVKGGVSFAPGLGFSPGAVVGVGGTLHRTKFQLDGELTLDTANKTQTKDGMALRAEVTGLWLRKSLGLGGGLACSGYRTSLYAKGSCRPLVSVDYAFSVWELRADYFFRGSDTLNRLQGVRLTGLVPLNHRWTWEQRVGIYHFFSTRPRWGTKLEMGVRFSL